MNFLYKDNNYFRSFDDLVEKLSDNSIKRRSKNKSTTKFDEGDLQIFQRVSQNLQKLPKAEENKYILESLKEDIKLCPMSISNFVNNYGSISKYFQDALYQPKTPKLLLEVISSIIEIDDDFSDLFSELIDDIFLLIFFKDSAKISAELTIQIMRYSENGAYNLIYGGLFPKINEALNTMQDYNTKIISYLIHIIMVSVERCQNDILEQNQIELLTLLHRLYFGCTLNHHHQIVFCFRMLLDKTTCRPSYAIPLKLFEMIVNDFIENPSLEYLLFFNTILKCDNEKENGSMKDTFYLNHQTIFSIIIKQLQNQELVKIILRLFSNFSYVERYCQIIFSNNLYIPIFEITLNDDLPFTLKDDPCVFFCRICSFFPAQITSYQYFTQLFVITTDAVESLPSKYLSTSFIQMVESLDSYIQNTHSQLNIDLADVLTQIIDSDVPDLSQWASSKLFTIK